MAPVSIRVDLSRNPQKLTIGNFDTIWQFDHGAYTALNATHSTRFDGVAVFSGPRFFRPDLSRFQWTKTTAGFIPGDLVVFEGDDDALLVRPAQASSPAVLVLECERLTGDIILSDPGSNPEDDGSHELTELMRDAGRRLKSQQRAEEAFALYGQQVASAAAIVEASLHELIAGYDTGPLAGEHGGMGHNNPPPEFLSSAEVRVETLEALDHLRRLSATDVAQMDRLERAGTVLRQAASSLAAWIMPKLDKFADELASAAGKSLGSKTVLLGVGMVALGHMTSLVDALGKVVAAFGGG